MKLLVLSLSIANAVFTKRFSKIVYSKDNQNKILSSRTGEKSFYSVIDETTKVDKVRVLYDTFSKDEKKLCYDVVTEKMELEFDVDDIFDMIEDQMFLYAFRYTSRALLDAYHAGVVDCVNAVAPSETVSVRENLRWSRWGMKRNLGEELDLDFSSYNQYARSLIRPNSGYNMPDWTESQLRDVRNGLALETQYYITKFVNRNAIKPATFMTKLMKRQAVEPILHIDLDVLEDFDGYFTMQKKLFFLGLDNEYDDVMKKLPQVLPAIGYSEDQINPVIELENQWSNIADSYVRKI